MTEPREHTKLHEIVLGSVRSAPRRGAMSAGAIALVLHLGGGAMALAFGAAEPLPEKAQRRPLVVFEHVVDLPPEPAPEPPPPPPEAPPPPRVKAKPKVEPPPEPEPVVETPPPPPEAPVPPPEVPPSEPPPAAQAGQVVAAEGDKAYAASFQIATGAGSSYAGGTTSAHGTGTQANHTGQVGVGNGTGRARGAQLRTRNWPCGWPPEAEELDIEETYVTIRAAVQADGSLSDVQVLSDPGYGFGKRAVWCARSKVKFDPALDAAGKPIAGLTPPLRVHFVRED